MIHSYKKIKALTPEECITINIDNSLDSQVIYNLFLILKERQDEKEELKKVQIVLKKIENNLIDEFKQAYWK